MSILDLKKASVFKNKLLTTEQKKLVKQNLSFEAELSDNLLNYDEVSKSSLFELRHNLGQLESEANTFKDVTNEITEIIIKENIRIETKLDDLKDQVTNFSDELSKSRNFVKDFEKFKKSSIDQIEKIKALVSLGEIRGLTSSKKFMHHGTEVAGLVQTLSKIITGFFLNGEANKKLFADVSESNKKRQICQTQKEKYEKEQSALRHAEQMELSLIDEDLKNEKLIIRGSKSDSALQTSLLKEKNKNHNDLLVFLLGGLVCLGIGAIYYIFQENMFMEDLEELLYSLIGAIIAMIIGGVTFETGWGGLLAIAGAIGFLVTVWESTFALSALAIVVIFCLAIVLLVTKWEDIGRLLRKGKIEKISREITNLKNTKDNQIQTSTENAQTKKTWMKTNFQNDLVDLRCLSTETIDCLKTTFKNLDVAKAFDYAAFKKEGKALSKALSTAEKNDEKNVQILHDAILLQLKNEITLANFPHDLRKGPDSFDDLLKKYEGLLDELSKQANYVEKIIEDTEGNLDSLGKIAAQLNVINLKEA